MSISENIVSLAFDTAGLEIFQVFRSAPLTLGKCRATPIPLRLFSSAELKKVKLLSKVTIFRMFQHEPSHKFKKSCNIFIYRWFPTKTLCINLLDPGSPYMKVTLIWPISFLISKPKITSKTRNCTSNCISFTSSSESSDESRN